MRKPCYLTHFVIYLTVILTTSSTSSEISTSGPLLSPVGYTRFYLKLLCKVPALLWSHFSQADYTSTSWATHLRSLPFSGMPRTFLIS